MGVVDSRSSRMSISAARRVQVNSRLVCGKRIFGRGYRSTRIGNFKCEATKGTLRAAISSGARQPVKSIDWQEYRQITILFSAAVNFCIWSGLAMLNRHHLR